MKSYIEYMEHMMVIIAGVATIISLGTFVIAVVAITLSYLV